MECRKEISFRRKFFFSLATLTAVFALLELGLFASGFQYSQFPRLAKQDYADGWVAHSLHLIPHPLRMWALKPGSSIVNKYGYQGPVVSISRKPGTKRILFLGDSCTNTGSKNYPDKTILKLKEKYYINAEAVIAGTPGYSTYQGLKWLQELVDYNPDILVIYLGWNDHWHAMGGGGDNDFFPLTPLEISAKNIFGGLRTYQYMHYLVYPPKSNHHIFPSEKTYEERMVEFFAYTRVPIPVFISNIARIIDIGSKNGIEMYFIQAPYGRHIDMQGHRMVAPEFRDDVSSIHEAYNLALEQVVEKHNGAYLVSFKGVEFSRILMHRDGIHPTEKGNDLIAKSLVEKMMKTSTSLLQPRSASIKHLQNSVTH